ncbi:protein FAM200A [Trichonephila clavipes]|nr:protein FAM200A [Trichonephila clavipes]
MEAKYESLLLHTEVRWLSRGKVISRVLKLKDEMKIFFEQNKNYEFVHLLEDKIWCTKLAYLSDIFVIFNNINSNMQGPNENILNSTDKLVGFKKQITLWKNKAQEGNLEKFESVPKDSYKTIKLIVVDHLTTLEERIIHYFPKLAIKKFDKKSVLPNLTDSIRGLIEGSMGTASKNRTWVYKLRLVGENRKNSGRLENYEQNEGRHVKRMRGFGVPW